MKIKISAVICYFKLQYRFFAPTDALFHFMENYDSKNVRETIVTITYTLILLRQVSDRSK